MTKFAALAKRPFKIFGNTLMLVALIAASHQVCAAASYIYTITAPPNWRLGNPQPVGVTFCSAAVVGLCGANVENDVTVKLLGNPLTYYAYTTPAGAAAGVIGSDVSIPTARWVAPATYFWTDTGPFGGGMLAFFNSIGANGVAYANEMIILDPIDESTTFAELEALDLSAGGNGILPYPTTTTINSDGSVNVPDIPGFEEAPEPATLGLLGLGCLGAGLFRTCRRRAQ